MPKRAAISATGFDLPIISVNNYRDQAVYVNRENRFQVGMARGRPSKRDPKSRPAWAVRLKELRGDKSQDDAADDLKIPQSTYGGYETGGSEPTLATFEKIAAFYKVSVTWLTFGIGQPRDDDAGFCALENRKHDKLFSFAFTAAARLLDEEGVKADSGYVRQFVDKLLRLTEGVESQADAQQIIQRSLDAQRAEIRDEMKILMQKRL